MFLLYINGDTPTADFNTYPGITIAQATGVTYGSGTINALQITGNTNNFNSLQVAYKTGTTATAIIAESNVRHSASNLASDGFMSIANSGVTATTTNVIDVEMGYYSSYFLQGYITGGSFTALNQQGTDISTWTYATVQNPTSGSFYSSIAPQLYSTTGGYSGTVAANPIYNNEPLYIGFGACQTTASNTYDIYINWARARAYPPAGVMPGFSFGSVA